MIKQITISAKNSDRGTTESSYDSSFELRPGLGEKKAAYYAVCTNFWCDPKTTAFTLCTYSEPLGDFASYADAKRIIDSEYNSHKRCPYCGFSHFRAGIYEDLLFDNENASNYFVSSTD